MFEPLLEFVRDHYQSKSFIPLHAPAFIGNEKKYVTDTIDSTFVSSVGAYVDRFEKDMAQYVSCERAVATVNGTAALHIALRLAGVNANDLVITQPLTFIATCNAIAYCNAEPIFLDVDKQTLGLSATAMQNWLENNASLDDQKICRHRATGKKIAACVPMHTFGIPCDLDGLVKVCAQWNIALVEDAAESLGSSYHGKMTGTFGLLGTLSFNGNKVITTGGGGMILTNEKLGTRAKHVTTTAKIPHPYEYVHDELGFNYRLPNLNAALGCAQLEMLETFIAEKRKLAESYQQLFANSDFIFVKENENTRANYWLNAVICQDKNHRDQLLKFTNDNQVMTRPIWQLMHRSPMYQNAIKGDIENAEWLEARVVNLPSSVRAGVPN